MCNISFTSLVFDEFANTLTLKGRADCNRITASVISPHITNEKTVGVSANGTWTIEYSGTDLLFTSAAIIRGCGDHVKITAVCTQDRSCREDNDLVLECVNSSECPKVELILTNISANCINGTRTATFEIIVTNPVNPSVYEIDYGDGTDDTIVLSSGQNPFTVTHEYPGGSYSAVVNSILPENCPASNIAEVIIPTCDQNCPVVQLELVSVSDCNADGTRIATFRITITNAPSSLCVYEIDYGDGRDDNISFNNATANPVVLTHIYTTGNYSAIVNSFIPAGCPSSNSLLVEVPACKSNCPNDLKFEIIDGNGNRFLVVDNSGIFEAVANNPFHEQVTCLNAGTYILRVIDPSGPGLSYVWREDESTPVANGLRDFTFQLNAEENKSITVITKKNGCTEVAETVNVKECGTNGLRVDCAFNVSIGPCINGQQTITRTVITPPRNGGRPCPPLRELKDCTPTQSPVCDFCCIWMWVNIFLFIVTAIFILITFCLLEVTVVSAIAALVSGGTLAAVTAALTIVNVVMLWICLGLIILSVISFILWLIFCVFNKPNACDVLFIMMNIFAAITLISLILIPIFYFLFQFGCVAGALIDFALFGFLSAISILLYGALGCFNKNSN